MSTRNRSLSRHNTEDTPPDSSFWKDAGETFFIRKDGLELKITLHGASAAVAVSSFKHMNAAAAESLARVQEVLLQKDLQKYQGQHPFAYLLALYNDQGWLIKTDGIQPAEDGKEIGKATKKK